MYQGGLCCLLITMMTICVANQVSDPEAELTIHQRIDHGNNGVHENTHAGSHHNNNKGHGSVKKKEQILITSKFILLIVHLILAMIKLQENIHFFHDFNIFPSV